MITAVERARLDPLERERLEINYADPLAPDFGLNTYTRLMRSADDDDRPLATLYAAPAKPLGRTVDDLLAWFRTHPHHGPISISALVPARLRPTFAGIVAHSGEPPPDGGKLLVARTTGTLEYIGRFVDDSPAQHDPRFGLDVPSLMTRSVQLAAAVSQISKALATGDKWRISLNLRWAERVFLARRRERGFVTLGDRTHRCFDRHLQLSSEVDPAEDGAEWSLARELDLQLGYAFGFEEVQVHRAGELEVATLD